MVIISIQKILSKLLIPRSVWCIALEAMNILDIVLDLLKRATVVCDIDGLRRPPRRDRLPRSNVVDLRVDDVLAFGVCMWVLKENVLLTEYSAYTGASIAVAEEHNVYCHLLRDGIADILPGDSVAVLEESRATKAVDSGSIQQVRQCVSFSEIQFTEMNVVLVNDVQSKRLTRYTTNSHLAWWPPLFQALQCFVADERNLICEHLGDDCANADFLLGVRPNLSAADDGELIICCEVNYRGYDRLVILSFLADLADRLPDDSTFANSACELGPLLFRIVVVGVRILVALHGWCFSLCDTVMPFHEI